MARNDFAGERGGLGPLEARVMRVLWERGECSVRDVLARMDRPLAYTTVMTTLDRLFKKQLLTRRKSERAFFYSPRMTQPAWEREVTDQLLAGYIGGSAPRQDLLVSSLVDALGRHDQALLDDLENKIQKKRKELSRKERP